MHSELHLAIKNCNSECIQLLINNGAFGWTPLHDAINYSNIDGVQVLLDNGVDTAIRTNNGASVYDILNMEPSADNIIQLINDYETNFDIKEPET
jgi:ankyrin repeat protein